MRKYLLLAGLIWPLTAAASPPEVATAIRSDKPYGTATLTRLWIHAYDATLWTDAPQWSMDETFALTLHYRMDFTSDELVDKSIEEMRRIDNPSEAAIEHYRELLAKTFPDVKEGDRITALHTATGKTVFYYNARPVGAVNDPSFSKAFFNIWLSPETSEPAMRRAILHVDA